MGGPALPQVDLDRVGSPTSPSFFTTTKSSANRPMTPSRARRRPTFAASRVMSAAYSGRRREHAADVGLAARSTEELVVGREELQVTERRDRSCTLGLANASPAMRSSTTPPSRGELRPEVAGAQVSGLETAWPRRQRALRRVRSGRPGRGAPAGRPGRCRHPRRPRRASRGHGRAKATPGASRGSRRRRRRCSSGPRRPTGATPPPPRRGGGIRSSSRARRTADRRRTSGCPARNARSRSSTVVLKGTRWARLGSGISDRMRSISRGRSRSFSESGRGEPSSTATGNRRAARGSG